MALHLVTGYAGKTHITAADHGALNAGVFGSKDYVVNTGNKFSAEAISANIVKVLDGEMILNGRQIRMEAGDYEEAVVENGTADYFRNDLICIRYTKDAATGIEKASIVVIKGTPNASKAVDPEYNEGNILDGTMIVDFPLYRVPLDGLNIGSLVKLFEVKDSLGNRIEAIEKGTKPAGDAKKLNGKAPEEYALQEAVDNIQTTSRATLSTAGWYRVAEYATSGNVAVLQGANGNSCTLTISRAYRSKETDYYKIAFITGYKKQRFKLLESANGAHTFTKIRYTYDGESAYLEVYYSSNTSETAIFKITHGMATNFEWKAITPTLTSETVDGVTVTTTYDIPANASPVNSVDLENVANQTNRTAKLLTTSILEEAKNLPETIGVYEYALSGADYTGEDLPHELYQYGNATVYARWSFKTVVLWGKTNIPKAVNSYDKNNAAWLGWTTEFTDKGGTVNGDIEVKKTTTDSARVKATSSDGVSIGLAANAGTSGVYDYGNGKWVLENCQTDTPKLNGIATKNLPLDGGGTVKRASRAVMNVDSTSSGATGATIGFMANGTLKGELGVFDEGAYYRNSNGNNFKMVHAGNVGSYALPLDGSVPMTGDIYLKNGYGMLVTGDKQVQLETRKVIGDLTNRRMLLLYNHNALKEALRVSDVVDGVQTTYDVHHDGNSAKVLVSETPLTAEGSIRVW